MAKAGNSYQALPPLSLEPSIRAREDMAELDGTGISANMFHPAEVNTDMFESIRNHIGGLEQSSSRDYLSPVELVEPLDGDPPQKAVDLVSRVITGGEYLPNGQFLWIDDPLQEPIPSWPQFSSDEER